jgi:hypothetical protein
MKSDAAVSAEGQVRRSWTPMIIIAMGQAQMSFNVNALRLTAQPAGNGCRTFSAMPASGFANRFPPSRLARLSTGRNVVASQ